MRSSAPSGRTFAPVSRTATNRVPFIDKWLEERARAFAIETGQIEGLYTLKRGITEQLIAEGLEGVV